MKRTKKTEPQKLTDSCIWNLAMTSGFAVSTAYGQGRGKLMPISDFATLKKFAEYVIKWSS
jgi:hypothetical protein